ncbi:MAG: VCBS repeat-containing protein, partial [Nitrospiraceae bacterium]
MVQVTFCTIGKAYLNTLIFSGFLIFSIAISPLFAHAGQALHFASLSSAENVSFPAFFDATESFGIETSAMTGAVLADINGDGIHDLYLNNHFFRPDIYISRSGERLERMDSAVLTALNVPVRGDQHGTAILDINNDGFIDIFQITGGGSGRGKPDTDYNQFLPFDPERKQFIDQTAKIRFHDRSGRGYGISVVDYNRDRLPDIFISNMKSPYHNRSNSLFYKQGRKGDFIEVGEKLGLRHHSKGSFWHDLDNDGFPDLLSYNNHGRGHLYWNVKGRKFLESDDILSLFKERNPKYAIADINNDGLFDIIGIASRINRGDKAAVMKKRQLWMLLYFPKERPDRDIVTFRSKTNSLLFPVIYHPFSSNDERINKASNRYIFIGPYKENPVKAFGEMARALTVDNVPIGIPEMSEDGVYIYRKDAQTWTIIARCESKSICRGKKVKIGLESKTSITDLVSKNLEPKPFTPTRHLELLQNLGKRAFILKHIPIKFLQDKEQSTLEADHISTGDFNNDGYIDFLVLADTQDIYPKRDWIVFNKGGESLFASSLPTQPGAIHKDRDSLIWDLNQDGFLDILITNFFRKEVLLLINRGEKNTTWVDIQLQGRHSTPSSGIGTRI